MVMVTHCVTEAEAQVHVFVTLVQQVITQFVDVYVPKVAKVAHSEGLMTVQDVGAKATMLKEVGFCTLQTNVEASAAAILIAPERSMLRRLCGGGDEDGPDSFSPLVGFDLKTWNAARRQVAANAYKDDAFSFLHGVGSKFNHSCGPNAQWVIDGSGRYTVKTSQAISAGEEITIRYSDRAGSASDVFRCVCSACKAKK